MKKILPNPKYITVARHEALVNAWTPEKSFHTHPIPQPSDGIYQDANGKPKFELKNGKVIKRF